MWTAPISLAAADVTSARYVKLQKSCRSSQMEQTMASSSLSSNNSSSTLRELKHSVLELVHWKQPKKSASVFVASLLVLLSLATLSVISVVSYLLLACLCVTITFRVYKSVIQAVQKSEGGHPFRSLLDRDISVSSESIRQLADQSLFHLNWFTSQTRRLLLVEDLVDSLKLAAVMWVLTYVGAVFNGVTILILADVIVFTMPLIYPKKKVTSRIFPFTACSFITTCLCVFRLQDKLPGAVKRSKAE
uniref:Reticulon n=1 Tax=Anabas testudineus TaxID=64144 RepID=A0A3Q1IGS0_ANATE